MKNWGSRVTDLLGYVVICWVITWSGISVWESIKLLTWILFIQWVVNFIKEVIEY